MKPERVENCPNIQIRGIPGFSNVEHIITLKTWMLMKEKIGTNGILKE